MQGGVCTRVGACGGLLRGFECEMEGVKSTDLLLHVAVLIISVFITKMSCRTAFLIALHDPGFSFNSSCAQSVPLF